MINKLLKRIDEAIRGLVTMNIEQQQFSAMYGAIMELIQRNDESGARMAASTHHHGVDLGLIYKIHQRHLNVPMKKQQENLEKMLKYWVDDCYDKRLDKLEAILKRIDSTNTVDDVRWVQAPHKTAKEILNDRKED